MKNLGQLFMGVFTTVKSGLTTVWQTISNNPQNFAAFLNFLQGRNPQQATGTWGGLFGTGTQTGGVNVLPILLIGAALVVVVVLLKR